MGFLKVCNLLGHTFLVTYYVCRKSNVSKTRQQYILVYNKDSQARCKLLHF